MNSIAACIHSAGWFLRRRDLLRLGYSDKNVRDALACHSILRVRQGWYSLPDAPDSAIEAVRVGGRLTSTSALESYGLPVPRTPQLHIAVPETASRLRTAHDRFALLAGDVSICIHWNDVSRRGQDSWRVSLDDALLAAICEQPKFVAIACASAVARANGCCVRACSRAGAGLAAAGELARRFPRGDLPSARIRPGRDRLRAAGSCSRRRTAGFPSGSTHVRRNGRSATRPELDRRGAELVGALPRPRHLHGDHQQIRSSFFLPPALL